MSKIKKLIHAYMWCHHPKFMINREWEKHGKVFDWNNPKDLNEKIIWLEYCTDTTEWTRLADKYKVREFIKERGLENILIKLYGKWDNADNIDFDCLPQKFVLKCNHDCGSYHLIDKEKGFDKKEIISNLNNHLKYKFGTHNGELHYARINPCVIAEEYIESNNTLSSSLIDYKIWCFNGKPFCIFVIHNRTHRSMCTNVYDLEWNVHPEWSVFSEHYQNGGGIIPRPESLDKMLKAAAILSKGFPQVRIDFYDIGGGNFALVK